MRKTLVVTKLGDEWADYLLTVACRKCRHMRVVEPHALAKILGWEVTLINLSKRLRCSSCGEEDCELTPNHRPRPRGKDFR